ncbi:MAG: sulfur carrier protein ThiS [Phycisphaerales bacterium]
MRGYGKTTPAARPMARHFDLKASLMRIQLNGKDHELTDDATVRELVVALGLADQPAAVEVNKALVPRRQHEQRRLQEGDRVEVVTLVGGG